MLTNLSINQRKGNQLLQKSKKDSKQKEKKKPSTKDVVEPMEEDKGDVDEAQEFKIEKILRHSYGEYLVKWSGYASSENTWEPLENIEDTVAYDNYITGLKEQRKKP
eukprot:UN13704